MDLVINTSMSLRRERTKSESEKSWRSPDTDFELDTFSKKIKKAIIARATSIQEKNPVTRKIFQEMFDMPAELITKRHVDYFTEYLKLATQQLVVGAFYGKNFNISIYSESEQERIVRTGGSPFLFERSPHFFHDIAHTIITLGRNHDTSLLTSLVPAFEKESDTSSDYESQEAFLRIRHRRAVVDERLASFWSPLPPNSRELNSRESILNYIDEAKEIAAASENPDEDPFDIYLQILNILPEKYPDEHAVRILKRIFNEYENNPTLIYDMFVEETTPLMQKHASETK